MNTILVWSRLTILEAIGFEEHAALMGFSGSLWQYARLPLRMSRHALQSPAGSRAQHAHAFPQGAGEKTWNIYSVLFCAAETPTPVQFAGKCAGSRKTWRGLERLRVA